MSNFNIRDSWGNKVGSIEQQGPGLIDTFLEYKAIKQIVESQQRDEFVMSVYRLLDNLSDNVQQLTSVAEHLSLHGQLRGYISSRWLDWHAAVNSTPNSIRSKRIKNHTQDILMPLAAEIQENVESLLPTIELVTKLNVLLSLFDQYFEFHNASCDRVIAQGLLEVDIKDPVFLKVDSTWAAGLDELLAIHTEIAEICNWINNDQPYEVAQEKTEALFETLPEINSKIENMVQLTNGREIAAERVLNSVAAISTSESIADELQKLANLKSSGVISDDEFDKAKKKLLS
jgi:hypothetical protein